MRTLFSVFNKIHEDRELNKNGVGLGLTISKKLSMALGGDIGVNSEKGVGSTFTLTLRNLEQHMNSLFNSGLHSLGGENSF